MLLLNMLIIICLILHLQTPFLMILILLKLSLVKSDYAKIEFSQKWSWSRVIHVKSNFDKINVAETTLIVKVKTSYFWQNHGFV